MAIVFREGNGIIVQGWTSCIGVDRRVDGEPHARRQLDPDLAAPRRRRGRTGTSTLANDGTDVRFAPTIPKHFKA